MGATPLRLLAASVTLTLGLALAPAVAAEAAPARVTHVLAADGTAVAALTEQERRLDSAAQVVTDTRAVDPSEPPIWLLVLLAPILLGGVVATGVTLRRLR